MRQVNEIFKHFFTPSFTQNGETQIAQSAICFSPFQKYSGVRPEAEGQSPLLCNRY